MSSTRVAEVLNFRRALPAVATTAHVVALLGSPTATEREIAELTRAGTLRRVVVPRRAGEALVEVAELARMADDCGGLAAATRAAFRRWLAEERGSAVQVAAGGLTAAMADQLVRAGFLTANTHAAAGRSEGLFSRPEDRTTLVSLETVARAASGTVGAVGGEGAVHAAGGSGGRVGGRPRRRPAAVAGRAGERGLHQARGGGAGAPRRRAGESRPTARRPRRCSARSGTAASCSTTTTTTAAARRRPRSGRAASSPASAPGRTKKWKEFYGLNFDWLLAEAAGAGLVELFETGSVGRGVRLAA